MTHASLVAAALAMFAARLPAQDLQPQPIPSRGVTSFRYDSPSMGRRYDITVGVPQSYEANPAKKYPALVVVDGNIYFAAAVDAARTVGGIEEVIIISVGTPYVEGDSAFVRRRVHEFSPPDWAMTDKFGQRVMELCRGNRQTPAECTGGAPKFLNMIVAEVLPRVSAKYRVDATRLGLFGVSAGGFFASWALFQPTSPFTTYIIDSPAMGYGDGEIYRQEERYASTHKDLKASVYFSAGSLELNTGLIVSGMVQLGTMLASRKYPGLKLHSEIHEGMGHGDDAGMSLVRGFRVLYAKP